MSNDFHSLVQDIPLYGGLISLAACSICRYLALLKYYPLVEETVPKPPGEGGGLSASTVLWKKLFAVGCTWVFVVAALAPQAGYVQYYDLKVRVIHIAIFSA